MPSLKALMNQRSQQRRSKSTNRAKLPMLILKKHDNAGLCRYYFAIPTQKQGIGMRKALYILGELADEDLSYLSKTGEMIELASEEQLISAGVPVEALYIITTGSLEVRLPDGTGLAKLDAGDVIGEMSFVQSQAPETNVVASQTSRILAIPRSSLLEELERNSAFSARFYKALATFLSDRLRNMTNKGNQSVDDSKLDIMHLDDQKMKQMIARLDR